MILLYLIFLAVATFLLVIGYNKEVDRLTNRIDDLIDELAFAGKNYVDKTNELRDKIQKYKEMYVQEKNKKAKAKRKSRQTIQRTNKKKQ